VSAPNPRPADQAPAELQHDPSSPQPGGPKPSSTQKTPDPLLIRGQYRLSRRLGAGSQGHTFLAIDEMRDVQVAIKRFDLRASTDWKRFELFERECSVLRSLSHAAIPRYVEHFEHDGACYLVMERVLGESLQERRARGERMAEAEIWRLLFSVGEVLQWLHGQQPPVIHRDIKPGNLVRRPDGSIALVDFGAVRDVLRIDGGSTIAGTFGYMAPEQMQGRALPQTDVYGLGATVLAVMSGREPEQFPHKGLRIDLSPLLASDSLKTVLTMMLEPDPDVRPRSVHEALGTHIPEINRQQNDGESKPRSADADSGPSAVRADEPSLHAFARTLPTALAFVLSLLLWGAGLAVLLLSRVLLPLLVHATAAAGSSGARAGVRRVLSVAQSAERTLFASSSAVVRSSLNSAAQRRQRALQTRTEARLRARELRAMARGEVKSAKRQARERLRASRRNSR
jgi:serine/threonine protein kinase